MPWLDDSDMQHNLFPLPIALVDEGFRPKDFACLLSASALWHLLPVKEAVSRFFASDIRTGPRWELWTEMGITAKDMVAPPRSHVAKKRARPDVAPEAGAIALAPDDALALVPFEEGDEQQQQQNDDDAPIGELKFKQWMISPRLLLGSLA